MRVLDDYNENYMTRNSTIYCTKDIMHCIGYTNFIPKTRFNLVNRKVWQQYPTKHKTRPATNNLAQNNYHPDVMHKRK